MNTDSREIKGVRGSGSLGLDNCVIYEAVDAVVHANASAETIHVKDKGSQSGADRFVSLSTGVRMEYVEQGMADGVPVIFLHGVTDSWRSFERVLPLLPPSIHAFALSQRGHGDTSRPTSGYRLADMSSDLLAFLDAIGLRTAIIVGHSMGASVTQRFVIDHPDRVERFVCFV